MMSSVEEFSTPVQKDDDFKTSSSLEVTMPGEKQVEEVVRKAFENENTPEMAHNLEPQNMSQTSAAVMQSVFFKEMVVKTKIIEDTSSLECSDDSGSESPCSCDNDDSEVEEFGKGAKEVLPSTDAEVFHDAAEEQIDVKEDAFREIVKQLFVDNEQNDGDVTPGGGEPAPLQETLDISEFAQGLDTIENIVLQVEDEDGSVEEETQEAATDPIAIESTTPEADPNNEKANDLPSASDEQTQAATKQLVIYLLDEEQDKENGVQPASVQIQNDDAPAINIEREGGGNSNEVQVHGEEPAQRPMTMEEKQALILQSFTPGLEPVLKNDHWLIKKPEDVPLREALGKAGHCATELIMQALEVNPALYHLKKERDWFGKNKLTKKGVSAVLARVGVVEGHSRVYWQAFDHIQRFSGTYIFVRHSLDHGNFHISLNTLAEKAADLRGFHPDCNNPERKRTPRCIPADADKYLLHPAFAARATVTPINPSATLVRVPMGRPSGQQSSPLSPRMFNFNTQRLSPKKRASSSKENQTNSPNKRQRTSGDAESSMNMPYFIFPRM